MIWEGEGFKLKGTGWWKELEVIGNIYENPELIKLEENKEQIRSRIRQRINYQSRYRMRDKYVPFNDKCKVCGFPNYDYQVNKVTGMCIDCEVEYEYKRQHEFQTKENKE